MEQQQVVQEESLFECGFYPSNNDLKKFIYFSFYGFNSIQLKAKIKFAILNFIFLIFLIIEMLLLFFIPKHWSFFITILSLWGLSTLPLVVARQIKLLQKKNINFNFTSYYFYQDYYRVVDIQSNVIHYYNQIYKAFETQDYFFIYINEFIADIIPKTCFTKNTSEEFSKLLTIKLGDKFKIK